MPQREVLAIVGGGVIGCAIAERMRESFDRIVLIERSSTLGSGASIAALGGITPQSGDLCVGPLGLIAERSHDLYPGWAARIGREAGVEVPILSTGQLMVATHRSELDWLDGEVLPGLLARGAPVERLGPAELMREEPLLSGGVLGGLLLPAETAVEPPVLMAALSRILLADRRVSVMRSSEAVRIESHGDGAAIKLRDGRVVSADRVVVAAGHLSDRLLELPPDALHPVKGQAVEFNAQGTGGPGLRRQCYARIPFGDDLRAACAVPRPDGRISAGVTYEVGLADALPTEDARASITEAVATLIPKAREWRLTRHWAGVRPGSADGLPVIGFTDDLRRVLAATGHCGLGITLAPVTVEFVAGLLMDPTGEPDDCVGLKLCNPQRFTIDTDLCAGLPDRLAAKPNGREL